MSLLEFAYRQLLVSPEQLRLCRQTNSVAEFLATLKSLWDIPTMTDDELLGELRALNQRPLEMDANALAAQWLPYRYHAQSRSLYWCLPNGRAIEPFQDQAIANYRQQLVNQLLVPKTTLSSALMSPLMIEAPSPAGFIFHLSRCGSTLVSGSIAELAGASVLSESPVLTECLLDSRLSRDDQAQLLLRLIQWQARALAPFVQGVQQLVIKWNAWDIFRWPLIRALFPQVPVGLLVRDPVEILASHERTAGRHMAGDPSMSGFHPLFEPAGDHSLLQMRVRILRGLLMEMQRWCGEPGVRVVDYCQLSNRTLLDLMGHFCLSPSDSERASIHQRMGYNAKELNQVFSSDSRQKQSMFTAAEREYIRTTLMPYYQALYDLRWPIE